MSTSVPGGTRCQGKGWPLSLLSLSLYLASRLDGAAAVASTGPGAMELLRHRLVLQPPGGAMRLLLQQQAAASAARPRAPAVALAQTGTVPDRSPSHAVELSAKSTVQQVHASSGGNASEEEEPLLTPLPNDTISEEYWIKVNDAIAEAARHTPRPTTLNDKPPGPTKEPWERVLDASTDTNVADTPEAAENALRNWEFGTPMPGDAGSGGGAGQPDAMAHTHRQVSVVPYDMQLGARIMSGLVEHQPDQPPPTQLEVDEEFTAACPMLLVNGRMRILAPRCGMEQGSWSDPITGRVILRWAQNSGGGLRFAVDSLVSGNGSVAFGNFNQIFSITGYYFSLYNCMGVNRYQVQEDIVKVDHMASAASSTTYDHTSESSKEAVFYKYTVKRPDGTPVAATALFRVGQNEVNITRYGSNQFASSSLIATARRNGHWSREQWHECTETPRGWNVEFPDSGDLDTVATVQDLRIVSAAIINLMAYRDEEVGSDGLQHAGQAAMYGQMAKVCFFAFLVFLVCCVVVVAVRRRAFDKKLRRLLFRVEQVCLPRRQGKVRQPVLHPTY